MSTDATADDIQPTAPLRGGGTLSAAKVPTLYVVIPCMILLGIGIMTGVGKTRSRDQP